jgi:hypothetical protein
MQPEKTSVYGEESRSGNFKLLIDNTKKVENLRPDVTNVTPRRNFQGQMFWCKADREFFQYMLEIDLTRTERRVLDALMMSVTAGNKVRDMRYQDVANLTGVAVPHVSTAIKRLVDHDLILVVKRGEYMVNPMYVYMGTGESRPASIAIYQRLKKQAKPG